MSSNCWILNPWHKTSSQQKYMRQSPYSLLVYDCIHFEASERCATLPTVLFGGMMPGSMVSTRAKDRRHKPTVSPKASCIHQGSPLTLIISHTSYCTLKNHNGKMPMHTLIDTAVSSITWAMYQPSGRFLPHPLQWFPCGKHTGCPSQRKNKTKIKQPPIPACMQEEKTVSNHWSYNNQKVTDTIDVLSTMILTHAIANPHRAAPATIAHNAASRHTTHHRSHTGDTNRAAPGSQSNPCIREIHTKPQLCNINLSTLQPCPILQLETTTLKTLKNKRMHSTGK